MTRLYLEGRTETVRPVTTKCTEFARAMCDPNTKTVSGYIILVMVGGITFT